MRAVSTLNYAKPVDYSKSGKTLYTAQGAGQKRTSLVFIGASVAWGDGLDMTQTYTYKIQSAIDTYLSKSGLAAWHPRYIHTDDLQEGGTAAGGTPTNYPYNGSSLNPGWGAGIDAPGSGTGYLLNPLISPYTNAGTSYGRSKLNYDPYTSAGAPQKADAGIFGGTSYGGDKNATWTNGGIRIGGSGQNIRWNCSFSASTAYMLVIATNNGATNAGVTLYGSTGYPGGAYTLWAFPDAQGLGKGAGTIFATPGQTVRVLFALPKYTGSETTYYIAGSPQGMSMQWGGIGALDINVIAPLDGVQATNHILVQTCARNSYCIQDYLPTNTNSKGEAITDLIMRDVCNSPVVDGTGTASKPFYVVGDTYNSMVTYGPGLTDRRLTPSQYASNLDAIGKALSTTDSSKNGGLIILTMPIRTQCAATNALNLQNSNGWIGSTNHYAAGLSGSVSTPQWSDYWQCIYNLAAARGWGFVDQSRITQSGTEYINTTTPWESNAYSLGSTYTSASDSYPMQNDGLHPNPTFATAIANNFIAALGLSGGA